jgi:hypothetical protein
LKECLVLANLSHAIKGLSAHDSTEFSDHSLQATAVSPRRDITRSKSWFFYADLEQQIWPSVKGWKSKLLQNDSPRVCCFQLYAVKTGELLQKEIYFIAEILHSCLLCDLVFCWCVEHTHVTGRVQVLSQPGQSSMQVGLQDHGNSIANYSHSLSWV